MRRKTAPANGSAPHSEGRPATATRATRAAARVAERFAHAPSYNEVLAEEARAAVRAAKAASRAAQEAQAAAQMVLEGLESVSSAEPDRDPKTQPRRDAGPLLAQAAENATEPIHPQEAPNPGVADDYTVEPAQPIYANLIEFPREMVATRKVRPRLAEGPLARSESLPQLSIFEVEPGAISTEPATAVVDVPAAPEWMRPEWPEIELKVQPREEILDEPAPQAAAAAAAVELAPMSRRLLAIVVDCSLIAAAFLAAAMLVASHTAELPGTRTVEFCAALSLLAIGAAYQTFFFTLARATPGMRYAGIGLSTLDGFNPSRAQRCGRLMALLLSILPLGLGLAWALFDENHLTWHDRLSRTYLRKG